MRLFFAIPIPIELRKKLLSQFPRKNFPGIRFTPEENLHITAHFLGETSEEKIPAIIQQAKEISSTTSIFEMNLDCFKTILLDRKPAMIWAQFEENSVYENLCLKLCEVFPTNEERKPIPHTTLARIKQLKQLPFELPKAQAFSFTAAHLELFESLTHPEGAEYKLIDRRGFS